MFLASQPSRPADRLWPCGGTKDAIDNVHRVGDVHRSVAIRVAFFTARWSGSRWCAKNAIDDVNSVRDIGRSVSICVTGYDTTGHTDSAFSVHICASGVVSTRIILESPDNQIGKAIVVDVTSARNGATEKSRYPPRQR